MYLYLLFFCDTWKSYASMRLAFAGSSKRKLVRAICTLIESGDMEYLSGDGKTAKQQAKAFRYDFIHEDEQRALSWLEYGYVEIVKNNDKLLVVDREGCL